MNHRLIGQALTWSAAGRRVVNEVGIALKSGEIVGVFGPNGSGKSVTLALMAGVLTPDSGTITLDDRDITSLALHERARSGIVYLPQEPSVFSDMSVSDNIKVALEARHVPRSAILQQVESYLSQMDLLPNIGMRAAKLSGGERRRLEIARALAFEPRFFILDEPFAGVDEDGSRKLLELFPSLASRGLGICIADHHLMDCAKICDRSYYLRHGQILLDGTIPALELHFERF